MYALYIYEQNPRWAEDYDDALAIGEDKRACYEALRSEGFEPLRSTYEHGKECATEHEALVFLTYEHRQCLEREAVEYLSDPERYAFMSAMVIRG